MQKVGHEQIVSLLSHLIRRLVRETRLQNRPDSLRRRAAWPDHQHLHHPVPAVIAEPRGLDPGVQGFRGGGARRLDESRPKPKRRLGLHHHVPGFHRVQQSLHERLEGVLVPRAVRAGLPDGIRGTCPLEPEGPRVRLKFLESSREQLQQILLRVELLDPSPSNLFVVLIVGRDHDLPPLLHPTSPCLLALDPVRVAVRAERVLRRLHRVELHDFDDEPKRNPEIRAALANIPDDASHPLRLGRSLHAVVVAEDPHERGDHLGAARVVRHPPQELEQAVRHHALAVASGELLDSLQNLTAVRERVVAGTLEQREQVVQLLIRELPREGREQVQDVVLHLLESVLLLGDGPQLVDVRLRHGILLEEKPEDGGDLVHVLLVVQIRRPEDVGQHPLGIHPGHDTLQLSAGTAPVPRPRRLRQRSFNLPQRLELHVKGGNLQHRLDHRLVHLAHPPRRLVPGGCSPVHVERVRENLLQASKQLGQIHEPVVPFAAVRTHELRIAGRDDVRHVVQAPLRILRELRAKFPAHGPRAELRGSSRALQQLERNRPRIPEQTRDAVPSLVNTERVGDLVQPRVDLHVTRGLVNR